MQTSKWDIQDQLNTPEDVAYFLEAALEDGDPKLITEALGQVARSRGITEIAEKTGLTRPGLYKAFSRDGDPKLSTLLLVLNTMGLKLGVFAPDEEKAA
jgi:probable addiction module antidote protein